jgi:hypothetical protein
VKEAVLKFVNKDLRSDIRENTTLTHEELPEVLRALRPDMVFEREGKKGRVIEILEFSCPYGYISHGQDTLAKVYEQKKGKYRELADALGRVRQQPVNVTAVIVSSMGAVYPESLKDLRSILQCSSREIQKLGQRMSDAAITGSLQIWRKMAQRMEPKQDGEETERGLIEYERREAIETEETDEAEREGEETGTERDGEQIEIEGREREKERQLERKEENRAGNRDEHESREEADAEIYVIQVGEAEEPATDEDQENLIFDDD